MPPITTASLVPTSHPNPLFMSGTSSTPYQASQPYAPSAISTTPASNIQYHKPREVLPLLGQQSQALGTTGTELMGQGQTALQPVIARLIQLMSGDPTAISEAILPETQGVITQYDAARRAAAEFTPRGGGQASAITGARFQEASDLANLRAGAVRSAAGELADIGLKETQLGGQLSTAGLQGLSQLLQGSLLYEQMHPPLWKQIGSTVGSLAAMYFAPYLMPALMPKLMGALAGSRGMLTGPGANTPMYPYPPPSGALNVGSTVAGTAQRALG